MNICFKLQNGEELSARTEEWVAAIIATLPADQKAAVFDRVNRKLVAYSTPGSHVLCAEGAAFIRPQAREAQDGAIHRR